MQQVVAIAVAHVDTRAALEHQREHRRRTRVARRRAPHELALAGERRLPLLLAAREEAADRAPAGEQHAHARRRAAGVVVVGGVGVGVGTSAGSRARKPLPDDENAFTGFRDESKSKTAFFVFA